MPTLRPMFAILAMLAGTAVARAERPPSKVTPPPSLVGHWRVVGCATSPRDPANCAHGTITFEVARWSIALPCCKASHAYKTIWVSSDTIEITSDGVVSKIHIERSGRARWTPGGLGGRVGELMFERDAR
jgi:hypothetical protein